MWDAAVLQWVPGHQDLLLRWKALIGDVELNRQAGDPREYAELLARHGYEVDAWETSYVHILRGRTVGTFFPFRRVFTVAHRLT